ncbi:unnamed protein product [Adineta steineri]|uniref:26S proteasome non-ATPase regulatory subunit 8 n=1 Tax=Adineta steineri TaxID=433720 RepID=A0A813Y6A7_9BILA|nr:unnamed protein product [Adineta steineri]CAF1324527.1 unnamed protein product [Adineta steineri]
MNAAIALIFFACVAGSMATEARHPIVDQLLAQGQLVMQSTVSMLQTQLMNMAAQALGQLTGLIAQLGGRLDFNISAILDQFKPLLAQAASGLLGQLMGSLSGLIGGRIFGDISAMFTEFLGQITTPLLAIGQSLLNQGLSAVVGDTLEIAAQCAILIGDIPSFERTLAQLKPFYFDLEDRLPESPYRYQLLGLNLLSLLSQNRLADFHTELELLPPKDIQNDIYLKYPVSLEQYLMEGSYNKVFLAKGTVPSPYFTFFMDILLDTIRDEIACCMEKSYRTISFTEAARLLYLNKTDELAAIAKKHGWQIKADQIFHFENNQMKADNEHVPADEIASQMIQYAREMEIII